MSESDKAVPRATSCEWPIKEDASGVTFCGCKNLKAGSSYCHQHHKLAYYTPEKEDIEQLVDINDVDLHSVEIDPLEAE